MRHNRLFRQWIAIAAVVLGSIGACSEEGGETEPAIATMRITIGATEVSFTGGCTPSVAGVTIPMAGAAVSAAFLRADGSPDPLVTGDVFELLVTPEDRFTRTDAFTGTLSGGAPGQATINFALLHIEEQHEDYGPCPLVVTVQ